MIKIKKISISDKTFSRLKKRADESNYKIDEYIENILIEVLDNLENNQSENPSEENDKEIRDRLKSLGYL